MKINQAGLDLIKKYEGFRSLAYRDVVGVWTIGYGHTSMAGLPRVTPGLKISRQQGENILARDVEKFSRQIRPLIHVKLNDNQFSALVSFEVRFQRVAGGKTLKGLVRRRAAEGELFLAGRSQPKVKSSQPVKPVPGKPAYKSTTNLAAILSAISGLVSAFMTGAGEHVGSLFIAISALVIIVATLWIVRERWIKMQSEGV